MAAPRLYGLNPALQAARARRAEALLAVQTGMVTIWDVFAQAATDPHLTRMRLPQLLAAQPGWNLTRAHKTIRAVHHRHTGNVHAPDPKKPVTVAWLLDNRVGGIRYHYLADIICRPPDGTPPWPGFPYRRDPHGLLG